MRSSIPFVAAALGLMVGCCLVSSASAQPPLSSLWPNEDGKRWEYQYTDVLAGQSDYVSLATLQLDGTVMTAGGTAQILVGTGAHRSSPPGEPACIAPSGAPGRICGGRSSCGRPRGRAWRRGIPR
jgi:hypothetical protein